MSFKNRLARVEARQNTHDFVLAVFDPVTSEDGVERWKHTGTGKVYTGDELDVAQNAHPGWLLWCRKAYDPADYPWMCETDTDDWTEEEQAAWSARVDAVEEADRLWEYRAVRFRLATGNSVEGYDEELISRARESLRKTGRT